MEELRRHTNAKTELTGTVNYQQSRILVGGIKNFLLGGFSMKKNL